MAIIRCPGEYGRTWKCNCREIRLQVERLPETESNWRKYKMCVAGDEPLPRPGRWRVSGNRSSAYAVLPQDHDVAERRRRYSPRNIISRLQKTHSTVKRPGMDGQNVSHSRLSLKLRKEACRRRQRVRCGCLEYAGGGARSSSYSEVPAGIGESVGVRKRPASEVFNIASLVWVLAIYHLVTDSRRWQRISLGSQRTQQQQKARSQTFARGA